MNAGQHDDRIRHEVQLGLNCMPGLEPGDVKVAVEAGVVTLTGQVVQHSAAQKAEHFANHVPGVRSVVNEIHVRRHSEDAEREASLVRTVNEAFGHKREGHD